MLRRLIAALAVALAVLSMGCSGNTANRAVRAAVVSANNTAAIVDALQTGALVLYRFEQEMVLSTAMQKGETKEQAIARVQVVRNTWQPVWSVFYKLRALHETLATMIANADSTEEAIDTAQRKVDEEILTVRGLLAIARARVEGK